MTIPAVNTVVAGMVLVAEADWLRYGLIEPAGGNIIHRHNKIAAANMMTKPMPTSLISSTAVRLKA